MNRRWIARWLAMAALTGALGAQTDSGRGVARVSLTNGDITLQRGDSGDWIAATVNAPLVTGDKVFAARASRAEVQFDHSNFVRLGENTEIKMADLENQRYQVQVSRGTVTYRILRGSTAEVEINTPAVAVRPLKRGAYRIEVAENGQTEITVRDGEAEVFSTHGTERLEEGRTMTARLGATDRQVEVQVARAAGRDDWDRWNERRDQQIERSQSRRYVHESVWGVDDLDDYGYWRPVDGYGSVWFPRHIHVGWSPYSYGRWVWVDWYGWSWVGYEPWGWAPYHYGRWFHHSSWGWGWYPGGHRRHYWSPALVGFFGWGSRRGLSIGVGFGYSNIGWVPLAPGEAYYPWYGRGYYGRGNRVNIDNSVHITNVTNVRNVYRNSGVNGGIVSVNTEDFSRGRVQNPRRVSVAEVGNAGQIRGLIPVVPQQESLRMTDREARAIPRQEGRDRFFTRQQPAAVERVPFAEQRQQVERSVRSSLGPSGRREGGAETAATPAAAGAGPALQNRPAETDHGWRRFGGQSPAGATTAAPANQGDTRSIRSQGESPVQPAEAGRGWRRVGEPRREGGVTVTGAENQGERRSVRSQGEASVNSESRPAWRRMGEDRRETVVTPQSTDRGVDRTDNWRRMGAERRAGSDATVTPQSTDRSVDRSPDRNGRRMGEERQARPEAAPRFERQPEREVAPQRFPAPSRERMERREEPRMERQERNWDRGGGRQIELNRPIVVPRGGGGDGGGRVGGGRPAEAPRGDGGGARSTERSGGGRSRH